VPFLVCGQAAEGPLLAPTSDMAGTAVLGRTAEAAQAMIIPGEPTAAARLLQAQALVLQ
jgi:hypothetical protein